MLRELTAAFEQVNAAPDARCVLLSAEGNVFSAGHNLKELVMTTVMAYINSEPFQSLFRRPGPSQRSITNLSSQHAHLS